MQWKRLPFSTLQAPTLPQLVQDLLLGAEQLAPFIQWNTQAAPFSEILGAKQFSPERRKVLVDVLQDQYADLMTATTEKAIEALKSEQCYTVTTGHQLNIFTGPAFFIYKLSHAIGMADYINAHFAGVHCVPIYWMASEDHDFEEISFFNAFKEKLKWERSSSGPVGRLRTDGLSEVLEEWKQVMRWDDDDARFKLFQSYVSQQRLAEATRFIVDALFGQKGLIVLDADHPQLKKVFAPIMMKEVEESVAEREVLRTSKELAALGYGTQVTPRDINLFYLSDGQRIRLTRKDGEVIGVDSNVAFSYPALLRRIEEHPEEFSPNVTLRPVYQEHILPNLCYIGGPGEIAYWLQLKGLFDALKTDFPLLMPRNGAVVLAGHHAKKLRKLKLEPEWLLAREEDTIAHWMEANAAQDLDLEQAKSEHMHAFQRVIAQVSAIDPTLEGKAKAAMQRQLKEYEGLEKAMQRAWKNREETSVRQLKQLHEAVWPEGVFQERHQNFFALEQLTGEALLETIHKSFHPTEPGLTFVWPEN